MIHAWQVDPVGGMAVAAALSVVLVLFVALVGLPRDRLTPRRRRILSALRLAAATLAILAMWRPTLVRTETRPESATLVVLADQSRSMLVADAFGGQTRWEALRQTLADAKEPLERLRGANLDLRLYTFDADLHPLELTDRGLDLPSTPDGRQTAIGAALDEVLRGEAGKRLLGVVLLTDGAQRAYAPRDIAPQTPVRRLADLGFPLYACAFGQARGQGQARDVAIKDLVVNQTVFVKNQLSVLANARIDGLVNQDVPVQLLFELPGGKMQVVGTQELHASQDGASLPVEFDYLPETPGEYKLTVRAEPQPGEIVTTNNQLSTFVTVLRGGLNVLYLEGALRVESTFLSRSLDASPDIKVKYVHLAERDPKNRTLDLKPLLARGKYDVYILGDVDSAAFRPDELKLLAQSVRQGAGLLMLGGFHAYGPGGYYATPLADLLPIEMNDLERQHYGEPIRTDVHLRGPLTMVPSAKAGARHFVMELAPGTAANREAWQRLPPLEGANNLGRNHIKRAAQVLAETPEGKPLLLTQEVGGRVMAFAADSTWHWWMGGHEAEHKRFWRQAILWLAHKDEQTEGSVWIRLAQRRYAPAGRVEFAAGAVSPHGDVVTDAEFQAEVILPDGTRRPVRLTHENTEMAGMVAETQQAGDYTLEVTAMHGQTELGRAKARFLVYEQDLELDNAAADPTLLASLAKMSEAAGGRLLAPEELPALLDELAKRPIEQLVEREVKETPWDTWPFFALFVGVLSVDWYLRKKWGLV
jgi:hypothetical protein